MQNYYDILDIHPKASQQQIKERFRFLANAYHPDKFSSPTHKAEAEEAFKKVNEAYQVLSVPTKRAEYDQKLGLVSSSKPWNQSRQPNGPQSPPRQPPDIYAVGQSIIRTLVFAFLFYLGSMVVLRMGFGGLAVFLLLVGMIYLKYFWK